MPKGLTNRERLCRLYDFEKVDRPTRWEAVAFWAETVRQWQTAGGLPEDVDVMQHYGFDPWPVVTAGLGGTAMNLSGPAVQSRIIKDEGRTQILEDDLGKVWRVRADGGESMPHWLRFPVEYPEDWLSEIKPRLDPSAHDYGDLEDQAAHLRDSQDPVGFFIVGL